MESAEMIEEDEPRRFDSIEEIVAHCLDANIDPGSQEMMHLCGEYPEWANELRIRVPEAHDLLNIDDSLVGTQFGHYSVEQELGRGGQGAVYLATDNRLGRKVALKVLHYAIGAPRSWVRRFQREADIATRLEHPNICPVYETGARPQPFIAMPVIDGETLRAKLAARSTLPNKHEIIEILELMEAVARAVHSAHRAGVTHRDIKPANIAIDSSGRPIILDFGLAHDSTKADSISERTGAVIGTIGYTSPEQLRGTPPAATADVWSLGVTLYEALTGHFPFDGPTHEARYHATLTRNPLCARRRNKAITKDLSAVLNTALKKNFTQRYRSAKALADDLRAVVDRKLVTVKPLGAIARGVRWARREPALALWLAASLIIAALAGGGLVHWDDYARDLEAKYRNRSAAMASKEILGAFVDLRTSPSTNTIEKLENAVESIRFSHPSTDGKSPANIRSLDQDYRRAAIEAVAGIIVTQVSLGKSGDASKTLARYADLNEPMLEVARDHLLSLDVPWSPEWVERVRTRLGVKTGMGWFVLGMIAFNKAIDSHEDESYRFSRDLFSQAIKHPGNNRLTFFIGWTLSCAECDDHEATLQGIHILEQSWPHQSLAHIARGSALLRIGIYEDAVAAFREAIMLECDCPEAYIGIGRSLTFLGRFEEAVAAYTEAIRLRPKAPDAHDSLGYTLERLCRYKEAIAAHREAFRLRSNSPGTYNNLGDALQSLGRHEEAVAAHREATRQQPNAPEAHHRLGNALHSLGLYEEAVASYKTAISLRLNFPEAENNLAIAFQRLGKHAKAVGAYKEAISQRPSHPGAHNNLGTALWSLGRHEEAITAVKEAVRLRPDFPEAHLNLGTSLQSLGRHEEAITAFKEAIKQRPNYPMAHNSLGAALRSLGRYEEAITGFKKAIRLRPNFPEAHINLGYALQSLGRHEEAVAVYQEASRLRPDHAGTHYNLGNALWHLGTHKAAITQFKAVIRLLTDPPEAQQRPEAAMKRLR